MKKMLDCFFSLLRLIVKHVHLNTNAGMQYVGLCAHLGQLLKHITIYGGGNIFPCQVKLFPLHLTLFHIEGPIEIGQVK